jgi:hypothetical protein
MFVILQIAVGIVLACYGLAFILAWLEKPPRSQGKNRTNTAPPVYAVRRLLSKAARAVRFVALVGLLLMAIALAGGIVRIVMSAVSSMSPFEQ